MEYNENREMNFDSEKKNACFGKEGVV